MSLRADKQTTHNLLHTSDTQQHITHSHSNSLTHSLAPPAHSQSPRHTRTHTHTQHTAHSLSVWRGHTHDCNNLYITLDGRRTTDNLYIHTSQHIGWTTDDDGRRTTTNGGPRMATDGRRTTDDERMADDGRRTNGGPRTAMDGGGWSTNERRTTDGDERRMMEAFGCTKCMPRHGFGNT